MNSDPFGMYDNGVQLTDAPDEMKLAWERYDEASTLQERLIVIDLRITNAIIMQTAVTRAALRDKELLMGECECPDDGRSVCQKCGAYARVIAWDKQRKESNNE